MSTNPQAMTDQFLTAEAERTFDDYSFAWEGELEETADLGDALLRTLPLPWSGLQGMVTRMAFDPARTEERLGELMERVGHRQMWWFAGPRSRPADLVERLMARGLKVTVEWGGLALRDLSHEIAAPSTVRVVPLSLENSEEYAELCRAVDQGDASVREARLAAAHRYLQQPEHQAEIFLAYIDGQPAGCSVLRVEPTGVAYLRNAFTLSEWRGRGVYLAMVAHRLAVARAAGCRAAVVQAQFVSSAPILRKRGFVELCRLVALTRS